MSDSFIAWAAQQVGAPYRMALDAPFDCSAFVAAALAAMADDE